MDEVSSPEKNDTKISNFGSVVCFLCHILWDNAKAPSFRLALVVSSNPNNFINVHSLHQQPARSNMRTDEVEWISAHSYDQPKWHSFTPSFSWKGESLNLDIVSQHVSQETKFWTRLDDIGIIFSPGDL